MKFWSWFLGLFKPKSVQLPTVSQPQAPMSSTPWMDLIYSKKGLGENNKDFVKYLSGFWKKLTGLDYDTIVGSEHAWCALFANWALTQCGYAGTGSASAWSFHEYGNKCGYTYGALIPIIHADANHHITFFVKWVDERNKIALCIGGNQNDMVCEKEYNLSGNAKVHDECLSPRWPVRA